VIAEGADAMAKTGKRFDRTRVSSAPDYPRLGGQRQCQMASHGKIAVRVVLLSGEEKSSGLRELLRAGSVVSKRCTAENVHQAIRAAMQEKTWRNSRLLRQSDLMHASFGLSQRSLTPRQMQVLKGILEGRANKEIAANLGVSETSVKCTVRQLFAKTETHCRGQLVRVLLERPPASGTPG
jgi:two-component system, NarL family, nitrate/nitrite response regulator NarL